VSIVLGRSLEPLEVRLIHGSQQSFGLRFWNDTELTDPADLTGSVVSLVLDPDTGTEETWAASVSGQDALWTLSAVDTDVSWTGRIAHLVIDDYVIASGLVRVQR